MPRHKDRDNVSSEANKGCPKSPDGSKSTVVKVGETQNLILSALYQLYHNVFTISDVIMKLKEMGYTLTHDSVFSALKRLLKRGIVSKVKHGKYLLNVDIEELNQNVIVVPKRSTRRKVRDIAPQGLGTRSARGHKSQSLGTPSQSSQGSAQSTQGNTKPQSGLSHSQSQSAEDSRGGKVLLRFTVPLDKFLRGEYNVEAELAKVQDGEEVRRGNAVAYRSVERELEKRHGRGLITMFDNVYGYKNNGRFVPWISKKRGGWRLTLEDLADYERVVYTEVDFVDVSPSFEPMFFTKIYLDKLTRWLVVEMQPPESMVKTYGVATTVRLALHELVRIVVWLVEKLLETVHGKLRKRFVESLRKLLLGE